MQAEPPKHAAQPLVDWGDQTIAGRQANIRALANKAAELRDQQVPGVQLWSELTRQAVAAYADAAIPVTRRCDFVIQDLSVVILGPFALKYLRWFDKITPDMVQDRLVNDFFSELARLGVPGPDPVPEWREAGYMSKLDDSVDPGLDRHFGKDFRPQINDDTDNQIFHTFFYQFMAYVTRASLTIRAASVYHEIFDKGGSEEDHTAALVGIKTGTELRRLRDSGKPEAETWHELILAAYAKDVPTELSPAAQAFRKQVDALVLKPGKLDAAVRSAEHGLIRMVKKKD